MNWIKDDGAKAAPTLSLVRLMISRLPEQMESYYHISMTRNKSRQIYSIYIRVACTVGS